MERLPRCLWSVTVARVHPDDHPPVEPGGLVLRGRVPGGPERDVHAAALDPLLPVVDRRVPVNLVERQRDSQPAGQQLVRRARPQRTSGKGRGTTAEHLAGTEDRVRIRRAEQVEGVCRLVRGSRGRQLLPPELRRHPRMRDEIVPGCRRHRHRDPHEAGRPPRPEHVGGRLGRAARASRRPGRAGTAPRGCRPAGSTGPAGRRGSRRPARRPRRSPVRGGRGRRPGPRCRSAGSRPVAGSAPEPDQLGDQGRRVAADVADHRDPPVGPGPAGGGARTSGCAAYESVMALRRRPLLGRHVRRRCCPSASGPRRSPGRPGRRTLRSIGDIGLGPSARRWAVTALVLHELVAQPQPLQHLEHLDQAVSPGRRAASPTRRPPRAARWWAAPANRRSAPPTGPMLTIGSSACALMSNSPRPAPSRSRSRAGSLARRASDSCSSSRMVPGWRRSSLKTSDDRRQPGVAVDRAARRPAATS